MDPAAAGVVQSGRVALPPLLTLTGGVPFVGRRQAWDVLQGTWAAAAVGARQVVLVPGEAGAGKTRLVTEFARHVHGAGAAVLYGTCAEDQSAPYQPFAEALDHLLAALGADVAAGRFGAVAPELARLVPRHEDVLGEPAPVGHGDPDVERSRLFAAVIGTLGELAAERPVLLVLDDLHWARPPTIELLGELVRNQTLTRMLIIGAYRSAPADTSAALRAALPDLRRLPGVVRLPLAGFDPAGVADFVAAAAGHDVGADLRSAVDALARQTDGNAFLLVELWQHLVETGRIKRRGERWVVADPLVDIVSPEGVRDVVAARLAQLTPEAGRLLSIAAVIGTSFEPTVLAAAAECPVEEVLSILDEAAGSSIVGDDGAGRHRFVHELWRRSVYDALGSAERCRHHLAIARALGAGADHRRVAEIANHLVAAVPLADPRQAVEAALRAADAATEAVAYDDALRFLESVLPITTDGRTEVLLRAADAAMRAGDVARAKQHCVEAFELATRAGVVMQRIAAALGYGEAAWRDARDGPTAARLLRSVLPVAPDEASRVRLQASLTRALALSGDGEAARVLGEDVLASARRLDDRYARRLAFDAMSFVPWTPQSLDGQLAVMVEAAEIAAAEGDVEWENHALSKRLYGEIIAGDLTAARVTARRHREVSNLLGQPLFSALDCQAHALLALGEGRFGDAEALAAEADELSRSLSGASSGGYGVQLFSIRREQGRLDEARPIVEAVARLGRAGSTWRPALAVMYAELGLHGEAAAEVAELTADGLAAVARDALWHASLSYLADACFAVGDRVAAEAVYDALLPWRGRVVEVGHLLAAHGAVDRYLAKLADLLGHDREAEIHYEAALRIDQAANMPVWLAHTQLDFGLFLAGRAGPEDRARSDALLAAAATAAERHGMAPVAATARAALQRAPAMASPPVAGLTDRELAVLALMAEGRSNRDIAAALHISPHTAANHVRSILMKTQTANRTEAAAWALHRGMAGSVRTAAPPAPRDGAARPGR